MTALIRKDLLIYFVSPLASISLALFLFITAFAFNAQLSQLSPGNLPEASMRGMLYFTAVVLLFVSPFLTMRSFAEETRLQTMELLKTAPITDTQMVLAKFFAVWIFYTLMILATIEFPIVMIVFGEPDWGPLLLSYLGLWLLGGAFLSVGVLASALLRSPTLAALLTFVVLLVLWFLGGMGWDWGEQISIIRHIESFTLGVLDISDVAYYLCFIGAFLFMTVRLLEAERWK